MSAAVVVQSHNPSTEIVLTQARSETIPNPMGCGLGGVLGCNPDFPIFLSSLTCLHQGLLRSKATKFPLPAHALILMQKTIHPISSSGGSILLSSGCQYKGLAIITNHISYIIK